MRKIYLICLLLFFSCDIAAQWELVQSDDGHWITTKSTDGHQLVVARNTDEAQFMLILSTPASARWKEPKITLSIDEKGIDATSLKAMDHRPDSVLFMINLDREQKTKYLNRMITGIELTLNFMVEESDRASIKFSLLGFTAALNDLLIATDIGNLDTTWLLEHNKERELFCYYTAVLSVKAMQDRKRGYAYRKSVTSLGKTGYTPIDNIAPDIVSQVYAIPPNKLPRDPRGDKYGIFKRCMDRNTGS